jgi:hypothetical protein
MSPPKKATAPHGRGAGADTRANQSAESYNADRHETVMRQMADRIHRLERREGWWLAAVNSRRPCCPRCYRDEWAETVA